uniref:Putative DNA binding, helix-turn-helix domain containing protein n=1 Tax=viral metagenome TaxID=1070528 RepID=A0A6M3XZI5_9ZZZZ
MDDEIRFNIKLLALLKKIKVSQKMLASETGLPPAYISRFINGTQIPTSGQECLIADALEVDRDEIFR